MKHHRLVDITAVYCLTENVNVAVTSNQDKLFSCQTRGPCTAGLVCGQRSVSCWRTWTQLAVSETKNKQSSDCVQSWECSKWPMHCTLLKKNI